MPGALRAPLVVARRADGRIADAQALDDRAVHTRMADADRPALAVGIVAGQVEIATGNEGFAPDNAEIEASERIAELFASDQETVMQILVRDTGVVGTSFPGFVRTATEAGLTLSEQP